MKKKVSILLALVLIVTGINFNTYHLKADEEELVIEFLFYEKGSIGNTPFPAFKDGEQIKERAHPEKQGETFVGWTVVPNERVSLSADTGALKFLANYDDVVQNGATPIFVYKTEYKKGKTYPVHYDAASQTWTIPGGIKVKNIPGDYTPDITFRPVWQSEAYLVTFDTKGGQPQPPQQYLIPKDHPTEPAINPSKEGYLFDGWYHGNKKVDFNTDLVQLPHVTYVAKYKSASGNSVLPIFQHKTVTVTFDAKGGSPEPPVQKVKYGGKAIKPEDPKKEGYTFDGWLDPTGDKYDFDMILKHEMLLFASYIENTGDNQDAQGSKTKRKDIKFSDADYDKAIIPYNQPYISGYPDGTFGPSMTISRAEMATILTRVLELEHVDSQGSLPFSDTPGHWAEESIKKIYDYGLILGYPDGTFRPNDKMKRGEITSIIKKYWERKGFTPNQNAVTISDMDSHWAKPFVTALYNHGIVDLDTENSFRPEAPLERAVVVQIMNRMTDRPLRENEVQIFTDVPDYHWAFKEVGAAAK